MGIRNKSPRCRQPGTSLTKRQYEILVIMLETEQTGHPAHVKEVYDKLPERASYPALISSINAMEKKGLIKRGEKVNRSTKDEGTKGVPKSCRELLLTEKGRKSLPSSVTESLDV